MKIYFINAFLLVFLLSACVNTYGLNEYEQTIACQQYYPTYQNISVLYSNSTPVAIGKVTGRAIIFPILLFIPEIIHANKRDAACKQYAQYFDKSNQCYNWKLKSE